METRITKIEVTYTDGARQVATVEADGETVSCESFSPDGALMTAGELTVHEFIGALIAELG